MFSKESVKTTGWVTLVSGVASVVTWLLIHFGGGGSVPTPPPLPKPDENVPITVAKEFYCEPGSSIIIEPKYIGAIKWSIPSPFEDKLKIYPFPANEKAVVNVNRFTTGTVYVAINGAYTDKDGKNLPTDVIYVRINTSKGPNPGPGPTPNPNPQPNPSPVLPDGKYKLSAAVYNSVLKNVLQENRGVSAALASNYAGIASKIAAGGYDSSKNVQQDILTETTAGNQQAFKDAKLPKETWDPFFNDLQDVTYKLYTDRLLATKEDFTIAWREISTGLTATSR